MTTTDVSSSTAAAIKGGSPVFFLRPDLTLSPTAQDNQIIPVVRVSIRPAYLDDRLNADPSKEAIDALALIDTGADLVYIDEDFAKQHGFETNETATVSGATSTQQQAIYPALFKLRDDVMHPTQAAAFTSAPLRRNGRQYDLILGMQMLSNGILVMDFDSKIFRFEFTTQADK
ncbi:retropepsin-like aspartic protease [Pseudomonas sp. V104_10]|uniref:retropepsin-like aspartic protease n=1 Tax=Pseudomonas sp. V104_10 TaxID=3044231 RepID=UPI00249F3120|nr:retropepsin-like aspartic protease [Pseudomonas sp. V104_10]MDI3371652.1 retropepsin-like aspartic protease [Pseudomonas sp. V104_10]